MSVSTSTLKQSLARRTLCIVSNACSYFVPRASTLRTQSKKSTQITQSRSCTKYLILSSRPSITSCTRWDKWRVSFKNWQRRTHLTWGKTNLSRMQRLSTKATCACSGLATTWLITCSSRCLSFLFRSGRQWRTTLKRSWRKHLQTSIKLRQRQWVRNLLSWRSTSRRWPPICRSLEPQEGI